VGGYECHVTFKGEDAAAVQELDVPGWKFSKIDGDPVLGAGVKCYLTAHFNTQDVALLSTRIVVGEASRHGLHAIRAKVEHIVYDRVF
jgi:hypothetical protein